MNCHVIHFFDANGDVEFVNKADWPEDRIRNEHKQLCMGAIVVKQVGDGARARCYLQDIHGQPIITSNYDSCICF